MEGTSGHQNPPKLLKVDNIKVQSGDKGLVQRRFVARIKRLSSFWVTLPVQDHPHEEYFYFSLTKSQNPPCHSLCPLLVLLGSAPRKHLPSLSSLTTRVAVEGKDEIPLLQASQASIASHVL